MDIMNNVEADPTEINVSDQHEELSESKFSVHSFSVILLPVVKTKWDQQMALIKFLVTKLHHVSEVYI